MSNLAQASGPFDKDVPTTDMQPPPSKLEDLLVISYNAQRFWSNLSALLETHQSVDVIMIQEMPWANYKRIASTTNKDGDIVTGTVRHSSFTCIGNSLTSAVCFYVNRRLSGCSPILESIVGFKEDSILLLNLTVGENGERVRLLNVYNHPKDMTAAKAIIDNEDMLPSIDLCMGDFNMHHPLWDPRGIDNRPSQLAQALIGTLQGHLNLCLANAPDNVCTWSSNNSKLNDQVLDLV
jgi:hypothetical protein